MRSNADGPTSFQVDNGSLNGINLNELACKGIALINKDKLKSSDWGTTTQFKVLKGAARINGNTINNTDLSAQLAGLDLDGKGTINLQQMALDYELGLKVVGDVSKDNACRVNERVQNIAIPVACEGKLSGGAGGLCRFDSARFGDTLKQMATKEVRHKVDKALDKQLNKLLNKGDKSGDSSQKSQEKDKLKDAIKGLFN